VLFCLSLSRNLKFCPHLFVCLFVCCLVPGWFPDFVFL
jgi:hypothetical protein